MHTYTLGHTGVHAQTNTLTHINTDMLYIFAVSHRWGCQEPAHQTFEPCTLKQEGTYGNLVFSAEYFNFCISGAPPGKWVEFASTLLIRFNLRLQNFASWEIYNRSEVP